MSDLRELLRAAAPRPPELDLDDLARRSRDEGRSSMRPFAVGVAAVGVIALVVVAIAIARAADGSSSSATGRVTAGVLTRGASETNAGTARMRGTITRDAGSGQVRTFQVQGSRDGARDASEIHSTDAELLGATETRTIGDSAYQRLPGVEQWIQLDRDPAVGAQPDLTNPFSLLNQLRDIAGIEPLGTGTIDGVTVTHYRVTIDMEALMKRLPPKYREDPSGLSRAFDVWVDEESRVRRFKGAETTTQVTWRYDLEFYDFGADIHVLPPPASEIVDGGTATGETPTPNFAPCGTVSASFASVLGIPTGAYTKASTPLGNNRAAWYVAGVGGALWVTDTDPASPAAGGLILPLNNAAHEASTYGTDVQPGSPIFGATSEADAQAQAALDCYKPHAAAQ